MAAGEHRRPLRCRRSLTRRLRSPAGSRAVKTCLTSLWSSRRCRATYEEVLSDRYGPCRSPAEHPSGARARDPDTKSKKRASGLHVLLLQAGQVV